MDKERFEVPEVLFRPVNIGLQQQGLAGIVKEAVGAVHPDLQMYFYENIVLCGGSSLFRNMAARIYQELRPDVPDHVELSIKHIEDIYYTFKGMQIIN